jgi:hypothetical protein
MASHYDATNVVITLNGQVLSYLSGHSVNVLHFQSGNRPAWSWYSPRISAVHATSRRSLTPEQICSGEKLHFEVSGDRGRFFGFLRAICGKRGKRECKPERMAPLRENSTVLCPVCMVIKDRWLEANKPALTIRRARKLLREWFGPDWCTP